MQYILICPQHDQLQLGSSKNDQQQSDDKASAIANPGLRDERKSRAPGARSKLRNSKPRSGKSKFPSPTIRTNSSKSPNKIKSSVAMLNEITLSEVAVLDSTPRGNHNPAIENRNPSTRDGKREQRVTIRRTVSSPVTSRKLPFEPIEKSSRARRLVDMMEVGEESVKRKSKSSRGRQTISVGMTGELEEILTPRRNRRKLAVDFGKESLQVQRKSPRNISIDSDRHNGTRRWEGGADDQSRTRKKKSRCPQRKKSAKANRADDGDDEGNRNRSSPGTGKSRSMSPSILLKGRRGAKGERASRKDSGRSHSPTRNSAATRVSLSTAVASKNQIQADQ